MKTEARAEEKSFIEEAGITFEQTGLPRMAGRIFGWLLIADPPYQSNAELAFVLMASHGSISTMTRLLMQLAVIERFSLPGVRHGYFRLRPDALRHTIQHGLRDEIRLFRELAERGLGMLADRPPATRKQLVKMRDTYSFLEKELPGLLERLEQKVP